MRTTRSNADPIPIHDAAIRHLENRRRVSRITKTNAVASLQCSRSKPIESAAKYLFKLSRDVILSLDRIGNILCINQRGVELSGYSESELRGANFSNSSFFPRTGSLLVNCSRI